jgi:hypothetical protein
VGQAIQRLAAVRLGRGFLPLAMLLVIGLGEMIGAPAGQAGLPLAVGATVAAGAMLAHGLRVVQRAFGTPPRSWWALASVGGLLPLVFGVYVLGWRGLRLIARWDGFADVASGIVFTALGYWILRSWQRLFELETLATVMDLGAVAEGTAPDQASGVDHDREGGR